MTPSDDETPRAAVSRRRPINPFLKLALELGPLVVFFMANARFGIYAGTGIFMAAVLLALGTSYALTRHLPVMAIVSAVVVLVFGSMTLLLHDETFIKVKPTIIYVLFAAVLLIGLVFRKPFLNIVFDQMFNLTDEGWRKLTLRWIFFFLALAVANEVIWRTQSTDFWVAFKAFGTVPLTLAFALAQYPLLMRYDATPTPEA
jgi:intracellular septation protein